MLMFLPACMSLSFLLPEVSRGLEQRQHRQGGGLLLRHWHRRPGFGDKRPMGSGTWLSNATRIRFQPRRKILTSRRRVARRVAVAQAPGL